MRKWAEELLWVLGWTTRLPGGIEPGSFRRHLIDAALAADSHNLYMLSTAFPELCQLITLYRFKGPAALEAAAAGSMDAADGC